MKEIIKKIIIAVLVIVVVGGVASFALRSDEPETPTQSTSSGDTSSTQDQPALPSGNEVNATTDSSGTTAPSQQAQNPADPQGTTGSQGTSDPQNQQSTTSGAYTPSQQGTQPSQSQQGTQPSQSQQGTQPPQQGTQPPQQGTQPSQGTVTPQTPVNPQPANKIDTYQEIFRSGKFLMKVNDPDLGDVTMAMSGNKMFVEASMEGITLKMLYDGDKPDEDNPESGTWYIVIDKIKKYSPMPADLIGNMNVEDLTKDFAKGDSNTVYTKSVETVNGEQLDCESCVDSNGNTTKYYFRGDQLVRSDSVSPSGEVSTTEFREINGNVDESMFVIPSGYAKWDISWLLNMAV